MQELTSLIQSVKQQFKCPISGQIIIHPVIDFQGFTYQHKNIQSYIESNYQSFITGNFITSKHLIPNITLAQITTKINTMLDQIKLIVGTFKSQNNILQLQNQRLTKQLELNQSNQSQMQEQKSQNKLISQSNQQIKLVNKQQKQSKYEQIKQNNKRKMIRKRRFQQYYDKRAGQLLIQVKKQLQLKQNKQDVIKREQIKIINKHLQDKIKVIRQKDEIIQKRQCQIQDFNMLICSKLQQIKKVQKQLSDVKIINETLISDKKLQIDKIISSRYEKQIVAISKLNNKLNEQNKRLQQTVKKYSQQKSKINNSNILQRIVQKCDRQIGIKQQRLKGIKWQKNQQVMLMMRTDQIRKQILQKISLQMNVYFNRVKQVQSQKIRLQKQNIVLNKRIKQIDQTPFINRIIANSKNIRVEQLQNRIKYLQVQLNKYQQQINKLQLYNKQLSKNNKYLQGNNKQVNNKQVNNKQVNNKQVNNKQVNNKQVNNKQGNNKQGNNKQGNNNYIQSGNKVTSLNVNKTNLISSLGNKVHSNPQTNKLNNLSSSSNNNNWQNNDNKYIKKLQTQIIKLRQTIQINLQKQKQTIQITQNYLYHIKLLKSQKNTIITQLSIAHQSYINLISIYKKTLYSLYEQYQIQRQKNNQLIQNIHSSNNQNKLIENQSNQINKIQQQQQLIHSQNHKSNLISQLSQNNNNKIQQMIPQNQSISKLTSLFNLSIQQIKLFANKKLKNKQPQTHQIINHSINLFYKIELLWSNISHPSIQTFLNTYKYCIQQYSKSDKSKQKQYGFKLNTNFLSKLLTQTQLQKNNNLNWHQVKFLKAKNQTNYGNQWELLIKNSQKFENLVDIEMENNKIQMDRSDLYKFKNLKRINLRKNIIKQKQELQKYSRQYPQRVVLYEKNN